eukprot:gb/GEZN01009995.1/.p1 GENE.gb/GEZN01009995.1/~~gb/GEZN01009995.1/.p1  ORF type:complete len:289 (+),score=15.16 gb/GEZN01009995.1/:43-867(+)
MSSETKTFASRSIPHQLHPQLWGLIWDWAGLHCRHFLTIVGVLCKDFRALQADARAWPGSLEALFAPRPVPVHVWREWAAKKVKLWNIRLRPVRESAQELLGRGAGLEGLHGVPVRILRPGEADVLNGMLGCVAARWPQLQRMDLSNCGSMMNAGLRELSGLPLISLNLSGCWRITDSGLKHLAAMPLRSLNLRGCSIVTDYGLLILTRLSLHELDLTGCDAITDVGLRALISLSLRRLVIRDCWKVSNEAKTDYVRQVPYECELVHNDRLSVD